MTAEELAATRTMLAVVDEIDVDGHVDAHGIRYWGKATRAEDGKWRCLADVHGSLCIVEINLAPEAP